METQNVLQQKDQGYGYVEGLKAGGIGIGDRGLWTFTAEFKNISGEEVGFSETVDVCIVEPVFINIEFVSETGGQKGYFCKINLELNPELHRYQIWKY